MGGCAKDSQGGTAGALQTHKSHEAAVAAAVASRGCSIGSLIRTTDVRVPSDASAPCPTRLPSNPAQLRVEGCCSHTPAPVPGMHAPPTQAVGITVATAGAPAILQPQLETNRQTEEKPSTNPEKNVPPLVSGD